MIISTSILSIFYALTCSIAVNIEPAKTELGSAITLEQTSALLAICINLVRRQLRASVEPPSQHGHVGAYYILDDEFARDRVWGIFVDGCGKFFAHQIGKCLANGAKTDGAAAAADKRLIVVSMVTGKFEHGQAKAKTSVPHASRRRQSLPLPIGE